MSDAAAEWGTPKPGRKSEKRQRSVVVSVRLNQSELEHIQSLAEGKCQAIGTYMRERAMVEDSPTWVRELRDMLCKMNVSDPATTIFHPFEDDEEQP